MIDLASKVSREQQTRTQWFIVDTGPLICWFLYAKLQQITRRVGFKKPTYPYLIDQWVAWSIDPLVSWSISEQYPIVSSPRVLKASMVPRAAMYRVHRGR